MLKEKEYLETIINQIICGDAVEELKKIPNSSIDLVITSPPYYHQREYGSEMLGIGNEKTLDEYLNNLIKVFRECQRIVKPSGSIVFNLGDKYENGSLLLVPYRFAIKAIQETNVKLINEVTWVKLNPTPRQDPKKLVPAKEPFFIFVKSNNYYFNKQSFLGLADSRRTKSKRAGANVGNKYFDQINSSSLSEEQKKLAKGELLKAISEVKSGKIESFRMKIRGIHSMPYGGQNGGRKSHLEKDGFTIIKISGNSIKKDLIECPVETIRGNIHPAVYPEFIIEQFLRLLTKKGDIVLDPFIGSGTTGVVAKRMDRSFIGVEINQEYCIYARQRIDNLYEKLLLEIT